MRFLFSVLFLFFVLNSQSQLKTVYIKSEKTNCDKGTCYQYKTNIKKPWKTFTGEVLDFDYQDGYNYTLQIAEKKVYNPQVADTVTYWRIAKVLSKKKAIIQKASLTNKWQFIKMIYSTVETDLIAYAKIYMMFDSANNKVSGRSFCNTFSGLAEIKNTDSLTLKKFKSTMVGCDNATLEEDMFQAFRLVNNFKIIGHSLYLKNNKNIIFELKKQVGL